MYGYAVLGLKPVHKDESTTQVIEAKKKTKGVHLDTELDANDMKDLVRQFKAASREDWARFPRSQKWGSNGAVFGSNIDRAIAYRKMATSRSPGAPL
jgi:pyruvate,orthophosphate dikinase